MLTKTTSAAVTKFSSIIISTVTSIFILIAIFGCSEESERDTAKVSSTNTDHSDTPDKIDNNSVNEIADKYIQSGEIFNPEALIPPQCYTKTEGKHNPCYVCHQSYEQARPNQMNDGNLQGIYAFSEEGETNSWTNLFVDRTERIQQIDSNWMKDYVNQDNYESLISKLKSDKNYEGPIPYIKSLGNASEAFDQFGHANDQSGWVSYNYKPFPSTFWPTNGSTGDAMIRLPQSFRQLNNKPSHSAYRVNLAILEMGIKGLDSISITNISEQDLNLDLNNDGKLSKNINYIVNQKNYIADASNITVVPQLFPAGTEFLHTVRYLGVGDDGEIFIPKRMKEVRYMKKHKFKSPESLKNVYYRETKEKYHENLSKVTHLGDRGVSNGMGWSLMAFIEDQQGELRKQHPEELMFCVGCHKSIGTTYDQTFSFARKVEGANGWGYINLANQIDTANSESEKGEYATYMERVGGGDEFRQNQELLNKWFEKDGSLNHQKVASAKSLYDLIMPSPERALKLNKAYFSIVQDQSFIFGRDANIKPATNVYSHIDASEPPLKQEHRYQWDIRLDWNQQASESQDLANN